MRSGVKPLARQIIAQLPADKAKALEVLDYIRRMVLAEPDEEQSERNTRELKLVERDG